MYLTREVYVGAEYQHRNVKAEVNITVDGKQLEIDPTKISYIKERAGYWRKANAIHKWFVDNIQKGEDDCKPYEVKYDQLQELKKICEMVLETKDPSLLPPQEGFFFGSTSVDECYFDDLKETIEIIKSLSKYGEYTYRSSW